MTSSQRQWETVEGVRIVYSYRQGGTSLERVVRKPTKRWIGLPDRPQRRLYFLDITRTQPIDSLIGYGKVAKEAEFGDSEVELDEGNRSRLSRVLRKDYTEGKLVVSEAGKRSRLGLSRAAPRRTRISTKALVRTRRWTSSRSSKRRRDIRS